MSDQTPRKPEEKRKHLPREWLFFIAATLLLIAGFGITSRIAAAHKLQEKTDNDAILTVSVIQAPHGPKDNMIVLPGTVSPWHQAPIYARTSGYLKQWNVDIGTPVKAGQVLATIDTPEIDAQYAQAKADLETARVNNMLAQSTAKRWTDLLKTDSVSQQEADEKISDAAAKAAIVNSAIANRDRLKQLEDFKVVVSPYDGVITARNTDTGNLITAGQGEALFQVTDSSKLRIYVQVPEMDANSMKPGLTAELHLAELPGQVFKAVLDRTATTIDPTTRTLLAQFISDNPTGKLVAGGYAEVHITVPNSNNLVRLPVNTLLFRAEGLQVATIDEHSRVVLRPVTIYRDFGKEVEINSGIAPDETIIINPFDSLMNGQEVRIAQPDTANATGDEKKL